MKYTEASRVFLKALAHYQNIKLLDLLAIFIVLKGFIKIDYLDKV
jgi:hypothetical protein